MKSIDTNKILIGLFIILLPISIYANAGVPMIYISYPLMAYSLIPIIIIESVIFVKLTKISFKKSIISNSVSNIISTLGGFPLAWFLLYYLEGVTTDFRCGPGFDTIQNSIITIIVEAAWLCPWEKNLKWLVPTAFIICLIIAFIISIFLEYLINKRIIKGLEKKIIRKATLYANLFSYGLLIIISIVYLIFQL